MPIKGLLAYAHMLRSEHGKWRCGEPVLLTVLGRSHLHTCSVMFYVLLHVTLVQSGQTPGDVLSVWSSEIFGENNCWVGPTNLDEIRTDSKFKWNLLWSFRLVLLFMASSLPGFLPWLEMEKPKYHERAHSCEISRPSSLKNQRHLDSNNTWLLYSTFRMWSILRSTDEVWPLAKTKLFESCLYWLVDFQVIWLLSWNNSKSLKNHIHPVWAWFWSVLHLQL